MLYFSSATPQLLSCYDRTLFIGLIAIFFKCIRFNKVLSQALCVAFTHSKYETYIYYYVHCSVLTEKDPTGRVFAKRVAASLLLDWEGKKKKDIRALISWMNQPITNAQVPLWGFGKAFIATRSLDLGFLLRTLCAVLSTTAGLDCEDCHGGAKQFLLSFVDDRRVVKAPRCYYAVPAGRRGSRMSI